MTIARKYEEAGVAAISCLTEPYWFKGSDKYLEAYDVPIGYENAEGLFAKHDTTYYACFDNWMYYFDTKTNYLYLYLSR